MNQIVVGKLLMQRMHSSQPIRELSAVDRCAVGDGYYMWLKLHFWNALEGII